MRKILAIGYAAWVLFVFSFFMLLLLPAMLSPLVFGERMRMFSFRAIRGWAKVFSFFTGIRYKASGTEYLVKDQAYIFVSNHTSFLDAPALPLFLPGQFRPLGKKELTRYPILGTIVKSVAVMVDRSSAESRKESTRRLSQLVQQGISIFIFPEGTMNRTQEPLTKFHDGAFRIAIETQTPILPMVILNAGNLLPPGSARVRPGIIRVKFAPPIACTGLTLKDIPTIKQHVWNKMKEMILEHSELSTTVFSQ